MANDALYERACADVLLRLDGWLPATEVGPIGMIRSLRASGLVRSSPDYVEHHDRVAHNYPLVYRRTEAGDRAVALIRATQEHS